LLYQDNFFGTLTISAPEKVLHDNEELSLIKEVAADISFALHNIELERKHQEANKELIESENKFRTLVENAFDAIYLMSGRRYEYVNSRFCEITGYSAEELTSPDFDFEILLTDSSKEIVEKRYKARERGEEIPNQYEIELETKYGDIKYVEMSTFSMSDHNDVKVLGVMRDTTQRRKAENEMMKAKEKAEESDRLKSAFLANMSHEIRTPMNGIVGFTQLLRNQNLPKQKQEKFLDIIDSRSKHLLQLIDDIIDISKIEANLFKIEYNKCSVNQLMDELFDS
jgi:PAS domain S-box-containing protein